MSRSNEDWDAAQDGGRAAASGGRGGGGGQGRLWKVLAGLGAFLLAFGGKLKFLLPLLKLGKVGGTIWSMLLMMGTYALIYPWQFAVGIVLMIFVHEMGHLLAAKRKGLPVSAPAFIPFVGALVTMKKAPPDAETEAYIAYAGPLVGSIGALVCLWLGRSLEMPVFLLVAWFGFFINLINLLPIHPLDGGRIVTAISRWLWAVGLVAGLLVVIWLRSILLGLVWLLFVWQLVQSWRRKKEPHRQMRWALEVHRRQFEEAGIPVPGSEHTRQLEFQVYSRLEDQNRYCDIFYPGLGKLGTIPFPYGEVVAVRMDGIRPAGEGEEGEERLTVQLELTYLPDEQFSPIREDAYYQVPARTRVKYGLAYFGLIVVLSVLLVMTHDLIPPLRG